MPAPIALSDDLIRELAEEADVGIMTLLRRMLALPVKPRAARRADRVLKKHGLLPLRKEAQAA